MADFLEERLPSGVLLSAVYDDDYAVEILRTAGGGEFRRLLHGLPMRRWRISYALHQRDLAAQVESLYHRCRKSFVGFRVRCPDDCSTAADGRSAPSELDHPLPRLAAGVYQLVKRYGTGGAAPALGYPQRTIFKPVAGSVRVAKNGTLISAGVAVDSTTGQVTITPPPLVGDSLTGGCWFDLPCRFDSPLEVRSAGGELRTTSSLDVVELLAP